MNGEPTDWPDDGVILYDGVCVLCSGWVRVLRWVPGPLRDWVYERVARSRYRWFGRNDFCDLGGAKLADRVLTALPDRDKISHPAIGALP